MRQNYPPRGLLWVVLGGAHKGNQLIADEYLQIVSQLFLRLGGGGKNMPI